MTTPPGDYGCDECGRPIDGSGPFCRFCADNGDPLITDTPLTRLITEARAVITDVLMNEGGEPAKDAAPETQAAWKRAREAQAALTAHLDGVSE